MRLNLWTKLETSLVRFEIKFMSSEKYGSCFLGYLFVDNNNMNVNLVQEGFATCHFTADR